MSKMCDSCLWHNVKKDKCAICTVTVSNGEELTMPTEYKDKMITAAIKDNKDSVSHPEYYMRKDAIECIDEMIMVFGKEKVTHFCLLNVWKYRYRAGEKENESAMKDLAKSDWYMRKYHELTESLKEDRCVSIKPY